jgi:hypothetical protein
VPFVFIHGFWFLALNAEPWITGRTFRHYCCCWRHFVLLVTLLPPLQQMMSSLFLGFSLPPPWFLPRSYCFTGVSAAVGVRAVACMHAVVFLPVVDCMPAFVVFTPKVRSWLQLYVQWVVVKGGLLLSFLLLLAEEQYRRKTTGCRSHSPFLYARECRWKSFERGNYPPPPHWDRRVIQPNHIKFRTCRDLALMRTPPINGSTELTRGAF